MADTKISALNSAGTLSGPEILAGVQGGTTSKISINQIRDYCRVRQDCLSTGSFSTVTKYYANGFRVIRSADGIYYNFVRSDNNSDLYYFTSTNYGITWAVPTVVRVGTITQFACWYDKWNPGDSGTLIHMVYVDSTAPGSVIYRSLDTSNNTLSSEVTIASSITVTEGANTCVGVTKTKAGRIVVSYDVNSAAAGVNGSYKSNDYPVTGFTAIDNSIHEASSQDYYMLVPGNETDTADFYAIFIDRSASALTMKMYDDSANTWTEPVTFIASGLAVTLISGTATPQMSMSIRQSDGHVIMCIWSATNAVGAKLRVWDISNSTTTSELTNVVSSSGGAQGTSSVSLEDTTNNIIVYYAGKSDGTETWASAVNIYYKVSTDGGSTWGAETKLTSAARALNWLSSSPRVTSSDRLIMWAGVEFVTSGVRIHALG